MHHLILTSLKERTGSLFGLNIMGVVTWVAESTNIVGLIGAMVGLLAGVMLVCIRWNDFVASRPVQWVLERIKGKE
jgi:hypothetical protein